MRSQDESEIGVCTLYECRDGGLMSGSQSTQTHPYLPEVREPDPGRRKLWLTGKCFQ